MITLTTIRAAAQGGRINWRYHALQRAQERGINREQALRVLEEGEVIEQHPSATPFPKCLMMRMEMPDRPLYVSIGYEETNDMLHVITVHWLDPEKWDDPWTRREKKESPSS